MNLLWSKAGWDDYLYWQSVDKKLLKRINILIEGIKRQPFEGIGNPEPLRHEFSGYWSRRINKEHRLVYKPQKDVIYIVQCRYHY